MEINRHNYEAYLLDQLEGSLSVEDQQKLHKFLLLNPDCNRELSEMESWILEGEKVCYKNSQLLKKEFPDHSTFLTDHNFDLFSIARKEGDLSDEQVEAHQNMVEADELNAQLWEQWQQTSLVPKPLIFEGKDKLRRNKKPSVRVITMGVISAAAAVALLFVLFNKAPDLSQPENNLQAAQEEVSPQVLDVPTQAEPQVAMVNSVENQTVQTTVDPQPRMVKDPVMFSIKKDHDRPLEFESEVAIVPEDDLQPRVLAQATNQLSNPAVSMEVLPDKIEPLHVPPVPIHMSSLSVAQISELGLQEVIEDYTEEKDFSLWKVAAAGIKGINKLAGSDISLMASRDDEGDVSGYQLKGKRFSLTRPLAREE
jgi:hypothetical protein